MDKLAVIQSEQTIKELSLIDDRIKGLVTSFNGLVYVSSKVSAGLMKGTPKEFLDAEKQMVAIQKQKAQVIKELAIAEKQLSAINTNNERARQAKANADKAEIALTQKKIQLSKQEEKEQQRLAATISLYKKVEQGLNSLRARYNELAIKKEFGIQLSVREEQRMASLQKAMTKYDNALKAVDATGGKYNRNVGNYASGFNAMNNSVAQLTREMPAFANSVQTGFMALSNNIPIFFDIVNQAVDKNKQLTAEGKKGVPVWKQLTGALFSFSTLLSIGVVLLTVYGKDLVIWAQNMLKGSDAASVAAKNTKDLNEAKKEGLKSAASEINQLKILYRVATDVSLSTEQRTRAVNKLQDLYPSYFGNMSKESIMLGKASKQYRELAGAIIASAQARGIENILTKRMEDSLLKEEDLQNQLNETLSEQNKLRKQGTTTQTVRDSQGGLIRKEINNQLLLNQNIYREGVIRNGIKKIRNNEAKANESLIKRQIELQNTASKYESDKYGKDSPKPKVNKISTSSLSKEQVDYLASLAAIRDNEIASQRERQLNGKINEKQYWEEYIKIITNYKNKIESYLTGANGRQRAIEASVRRRAVEEIVKVNKEIYDINFKENESNHKLKIQELEKQSNEIAKNDYLSNSDRLTKQIEIDDKLISETSEYWKTQIELAKLANQETLSLETKRDEEINKLQDNRLKNTSSIFDNFKKDIEEQNKYLKTLKGITFEEQRQKILSDKKLSNAQKEYLLDVLSLENQKEQNKIEIEGLQKQNAELEKKAGKLPAGTLLTPEELQLQANNLEKIAQLGNQNIEIDISLKDKLSPQLEALKNIFTNGFRDLGLDNFADQFDNLFDKIKEKTADWEDYTAASFALIGDIGSQYVEARKEQEISALDEQLKRTQEVTEQELSFIDSRLERLNSLDELSKEQISERNALEDEARVLKEQQFQREKQIAAQKAKAQQRAASQQALINGFLAATKTLAELGVPIGIAPAAVALGFGVLQAGLIMSKNPVPEYFVGRKGGNAEWAITQDRYGAEAISDKKGNIKTWGNDKGGQLTWLEKGDNVHTATETKKMLSEIDNMPKLGSNVFNKIASQNVTPILIQKDNIDYDKLAVKVGSEFRRGLKYFDKPTVTTDVRGNKYLHEGGKIPVFLGREKKNTIIIKSGNNERN